MKNTIYYSNVDLQGNGTRVLGGSVFLVYSLIFLPCFFDVLLYRDDAPLMLDIISVLFIGGFFLIAYPVLIVVATNTKSVTIESEQVTVKYRLFGIDCARREFKLAEMQSIELAAHAPNVTSHYIITGEGLKQDMSLKPVVYTLLMRTAQGKLRHVITLIDADKASYLQELIANTAPHLRVEQDLTRVSSLKKARKKILSRIYTYIGRGALGIGGIILIEFISSAATKPPTYILLDIALGLCAIGGYMLHIAHRKKDDE